jgi:hypothetical protein
MRRSSLLSALLTVLAAVNVLAQAPARPVFKFAVSGDSRNCGDVVMPAIAASVLKSGASFYWHLGDFRAIYDFDEDMAPPGRLGLNAPHLTIATYLQRAWPDFISRQLMPFGSLEIFLGIGNHETIYPKTHAEWIERFGAWLNTPRLHAQRQKDGDTAGGPRSYFHWVMNDVDFLSLDNATGNAFDAAQLAWIRRRLAADQRSRSITTVVVGMHEALPGSKGMSHSMCAAPAGVESGRAVYKLLWALEQSGKKVYVLASHSHFVMDDIYNTAYWKDQVLPGWIVGTAGAVRYRLPAGVPTATIARTDVYGYLLGTVMSDGAIHFDFHETDFNELRQANEGKTPEPLVRWCYAENSDQGIAAQETCAAGGR